MTSPFSLAMMMSLILLPRREMTTSRVGPAAGKLAFYHAYESFFFIPRAPGAF
jgi:hypothetical protein